MCRIGEAPFEIISGDVFRVEVDGALKATRMESRHFTRSLKGRERRSAQRSSLGASKVRARPGSARPAFSMSAGRVPAWL
jgi:hypothetical protein